MFNRLIKFSKNNSFFLFGARGTGKTYLLKDHFKPARALYIDLLAPDQNETYSEAFCLSLDPTPKKIGAVRCLPWQRGLEEIGL